MVHRKVDVFVEIYVVLVGGEAVESLLLTNVIVLGREPRYLSSTIRLPNNFLPLIL